MISPCRTNIIKNKIIQKNDYLVTANMEKQKRQNCKYFFMNKIKIFLHRSNRCLSIRCYFSEVIFAYPNDISPVERRTDVRLLYHKCQPFTFYVGALSQERR